MVALARYFIEDNPDLFIIVEQEHTPLREFLRLYGIRKERILYTRDLPIRVGILHNHSMPSVITMFQQRFGLRGSGFRIVIPYYIIRRSRIMQKWLVIYW